MAPPRCEIFVRIAAVLLAVLLSLVPASMPQRPPERASSGETMPFSAYSKALRKIAERFPDQRSDRSLSFPADHGAHPNVPAEIWEFTVQMQSADGYRYGLVQSFTRFGLGPEQPQRPSAWAAREVYRGLFAFLDANRRQYGASERFARAALGMSGYDPVSGLLWLDHWKVRVPLGEPRSYTLQGEARGTRIDLRLEPRKPAVALDPRNFPAAAGGRLQGYILSRLAVSGTIHTGGRRQSVTGRAWLNRSWGKIAPPGGQVALNRYQMQLDDGREFLILQLRRRDGSAAPLASGLVIEADGGARAISRNDVRIEPGDAWLGAGGIKYPLEWSVQLPGLETELRLSPLVEDQEIAGSVRAWSGAVSVSGTGRDGKALSGQGFMELTGY